MQHKRKQFCKRVIATVCAISMALGGVLSDIGAREASAAAEHTLWLVGDSTVCSFNDTYYYPRYGYGTQIGNYLDDAYTVKNLAVSGTSSKSYLADKNYIALKSGIKAGDTLMIGFGHNDEKAEEARYTNPNGDWQTEGSFAKSLYDNYVKVAQDAGAEVILCTPIVRRTAGDTFSDDKLHITKDSGSYKGGDYPAAIRKLGADKDIPVVDLTRRTQELYTDLGPDATLELHCWQGASAATVDNTHLNLYGAQYVAWLFAKDAKDTGTSLAAHIAVKDTAPEKNLEAAKHPDYQAPDYDANLPESKLWPDYKSGDGGTGDGADTVCFKGTVFGNLGEGEPGTENYTLETDAQGNMHIQVKGNKGGVSQDADGIAMYYYKIPAGSQFELSAKATVHSLGTDSGSAFGLMARDDMYIDKNGFVTSDYVAAGTLGTGCNSFYRRGGVLGGKAALETETLVEGSSYNLSIVSNPDGYACTFGSEKQQSAGYDFQLSAVDGDSFYIGMFAAKNADVTYSRLYLKVDGKVLTDHRKTEYKVTVGNDGHGTARGSATSAAAGETVKLTADPEEGYVFKEWKVISGNVTVQADAFVMPGTAVEVQAVFEKLRTEWDFAADSSIAGSNGVLLAGEKGATAGLQIDATNGRWDSTGSLSSGWVSVKQGTVITVPVAGASKVTVYAQTADYTVDGTKATVADGYETFSAKGKDKKVTIAVTADTALKSIKVEASPERTIDVWDFGVKLEADTDTYTNHITPEAVRKAEILAAGAYSKTAGTAFGDLTQYHAAKDRFYTKNADVTDLGQAKDYSLANNPYDDGYTAQGAWYCNGAGSSSSRYLTIANVQAGDKIVAYMGSMASGDITFHFEGQDGAAAQKETCAAASGTFVKCEFVAEYAGVYKIWPEGAGKPMYHRVMRIPGVSVSGTIDFGEYTGTDYVVKFVNQTTRSETEALVADRKFTVLLAAGYTYRAVLSGAEGFGFTSESRDVTLTDTDALTGKAGVALLVESKSTYLYSGRILGFAAGYDLSKLTAVMVPPTDSNADEAPLTIDAQLNFTATLEPDLAYTVRLGGVNDYEVRTPVKVESGDAYTEDITVAPKPVYEVKGGFLGLGSAKVTELTFTNVEDAYVYTATLDENGYKINLRDGSYLAKAAVTGFATRTHVVVKGGAVDRDLLFVSTAQAAALPRVSDIYVGYPRQKNNYDTMGEALAACAAMKPASEKERITVHIAPGTYREQLILETPYVSLVNDTDEEVLLTWYYGIGYQYYSVDTGGFYNAETAYDRFEKKTVAKWGASVYVKKTATAFRAEGITFENSFNRYLTDEELEDGVELAHIPDSKIAVERKYGADILSKAATERAAALVIEADEAEFKDCAVLSSQDTLITGNAATHLYFKDCVIEGQTDYICGDGNCVFDTCELRFKGYSADSLGGYITAAKPSADTAKGYLFRNCTVSANGNSRMTVKPGYFGRPWDPKARVLFLNTKLEKADLIVAAAWTEMNGSQPENANFGEYNTTTLNGVAVSTTGRRGELLTKEQADAVKATDYFGSWTPAFYREEAAEVAFATAPFVTDNGDLNTPYPGHTLTVGYSLGAANDANDASLIQWYRVKDGQETLVKTSNATLGKTYKIAKEDVGSRIKVVVTPVTVSGSAGAAASCTVDGEVREGYEDPDATGPGAALGDGVNIFLAGDSTVKDYSEKGINSGGTARNEGSWGEFFQQFFDSDKVTVVNYANGGRSSRNFINEGSLDKIKQQIGKGDYLFIQFGHNDCANGKDYLADRYVPLGTPDADGVYPSTPGVKKPTPAELAGSKYGDTCYTYDCGGTYKWYLQQYIDVAKEAGATPVLVTPVSRMYYNSDGAIKTHHDSIDTTTGTQVTTGNAYVEAVKQLAGEQDVLLVDGFELTKQLFEDAYKAGGSDVYGTQIMHSGDKTHSNKLGGLLQAAAIASVVQELKLDISYVVKAPGQVMGETTDHKTVFTVNGSGRLTAYDINSGYAERASYWEAVGQKLIDAIAEKAEELGGGSKPPTPSGEGEGLKILPAEPDRVYTYDGSAQKPAILVYNNGELLTEGVDYTVKYSNNVKAAAADSGKNAPTVTVTGKGAFTGKADAQFTIHPRALTDVTVGGLQDGKLVVAENTKVSPVLVYKGVLLKAGDKKDFVLDKPDEKYTAGAENPEITITGKNNYTGELKLALEVKEKAVLKKLSSVKLDTKTKLVYDGTAKAAPVLEVKAGGDVLTENDYRIVYSGDQTSAGTQKFTVIGMGLYTGSIAKSYKLQPRKTTLKVEVDDRLKDENGVVTCGFNPAGVTLGDALTVSDEGDEIPDDKKTLVPGRDYKVSYSSNKKAGTAKYTVTFLGNYKGSAAVKNQTFTVTATDLAALEADDALYAVSADKVYTKAALYKSAPYVLVNGVALKSSDYTVKYYLDPKPADADTARREMKGKNKVELGAEDTETTVYVEITGKKNYTGAVETAYKVVKAGDKTDISKAGVTFKYASDGRKQSKVEYTGEAVYPETIEIKVGKAAPVILQPDAAGSWDTADFRVEFVNNIAKGKATAIITGTGGNVGSRTATFSIVAQNVQKLKDFLSKMF